MGAVIAAVGDRDYQRRMTSARNVSVRSHLLSAVMLVLSSAAVGVGAVLDEGKRVFTIPFSVIIGFVGLALHLVVFSIAYSCRALRLSRCHVGVSMTVRGPSSAVGVSK